MRNLGHNTMLFVIFLVVLPVHAQVSRGGHPLNNTEDFEPSKVIYLLEPLDKEIMRGQKSMSMNTYKKALDFAIERHIDLSPEYNGEWIEKDGAAIWRVHLISPEAYSLGILFSEFELLSDVELFVYDPDGNHVKGSFTSESNKDLGYFYVGHVPGDELIVELRSSRQDGLYGKLRIESLSHAYLPVYAKETVVDSIGLGFSQDCEIDIICTEGEDWQTMKRSVVRLDAFGRYCTGVLINNTAYDGKPYILTAEHCINSAFRAGICVFSFGFENSECGIDDGSLDNSVSGSTLLATTDSIDFSIVRLYERPPREYNTYYAGWDIREQNHTGVTVLHHPNADAMKISYESDATMTPTSLPGDLNDYILKSELHVRQWDFGTTEGGSSGAPLFNSSKRVVGLLSGGLAYCGDSIGYDALKNRVIYSLTENKNDYFSRLSFAWDYYSSSNMQLKKWLDPIGAGQSSIGGLNSSSLDVETKQKMYTSLNIYPNPAREEVFIGLTEYTGREIELNLFDVTGKLVLSERKRSVYPISLTLPDLDGGMYLIQMVQDGNVASARIIVD